MSQEQLRLVLADDDPDIRRILKAVLAQDGVEVVAEAADGRQAIMLADEMRPHVMLFDLMMPIVGGAEAARAISRRWPDIVLVRLTAGGREAEEHLLQAGAHRVFDKTQIHELLEWLTSPATLLPLATRNGS